MKAKGYTETQLAATGHLVDEAYRAKVDTGGLSLACFKGGKGHQHCDTLKLPCNCPHHRGEYVPL